MRPVLLLCIAISLACRCPTAAFAQSNKTRPNLVVIIADDLGWGDVGYYGSDTATPALDRMKREGVELNRFYTYPTCSPTRASLLSGRNPARFGLTPIRRLPPGLVTLPETLAKSGYRTSLIGKWHLGTAPEDRPLTRGFQHFYGYLGGKIHHLGPRHSPEEQLYRDESPVDDFGHTTDLFTRKALSELTRSSSQPLYLQVAYSAPHYPLEETGEWLKRYSGTIADRHRQTNAAMVTHLDDGIGRLLGAIRESKNPRETVVLFFSDNGAQKDRMDSRDTFGRWPYLGSNQPLRGWKEELYEGGIRVPALFWRSSRRRIARCDAPLAVWDVFPTLATLAGTAVPSGLDGIDFSPALQGRSMPERTLFWQTADSAALRYGEHKLILADQHASKSAERYQLGEDPREAANLISRNPQFDAFLLEELRRLAPPPPQRSRRQFLPMVAAAGVGAIFVLALWWRRRRGAGYGSGPKRDVPGRR